MQQSDQGKMSGLHGDNAIQINSQYHDNQSGAFFLFWLNATPVKTGISSVYSLRVIICQQMVDAKKWCKLMFGNYVEVHKENVITNLMIPRTRPGIYIGPSGNIEGSVKFMCFDKGKKIGRRNYTRLSIPDS